MTALDDLAPYPETRDDVTAEKLARHFAVEAYVRCKETTQMCSRLSKQGKDADWAPYHDAVDTLFAQFGVVRLLRALIHRMPARADFVACDLFAKWSEADLAEWLSEWLSGYGIDPDEVSRLAAEQRAEQAVTS